jgi:hypothetical protein
VSQKRQLSHGTVDNLATECVHCSLELNSIMGHRDGSEALLSDGRPVTFGNGVQVTERMLLAQAPTDLNASRPEDANVVNTATAASCPPRLNERQPGSISA